MIVSRTPYRISFFGGSSDYQSWYSKHGGLALSTTINHYSYISARWRPPFFPDKSRIVWNRIEEVVHHMDILHPSVRACLKYLNIENGVEIHHLGDLPARSGLGSSSTFTVGLLNALYALQGVAFNGVKKTLAKEAIHIERDIMQENVGIQDQIAAAYGGFNRTSILPNGDFFVDPVIISPERLEKLQSCLVLFFTGVSRTASDIAAEQVANTDRNEVGIHRMQAMVDESLGILTSDGDISEFGRLLRESWAIKRTLAKNISPQFVDDIYERGRKAGAIGGKLLGAGGGGHILFFAWPDDHDRIRKKLKDLLWVPFKFETDGSQIIFNEPNSYSRESLTRWDYSRS